VLSRILVDVDIEELNDVLRTNRYTQVDEDYDNDEINTEDCDGYDKKEDNFWLISTTRMCNAINYNVTFINEINFDETTMTFIYY